MAKDIHEELETENIPYYECDFMAQRLISKGWIKPLKDSIVLSREEYEKLNMKYISALEQLENKSKETAEKIREMVKQKSFSTWFNVDDNPRKEILVSLSDIDKIIKSLGIEIKE